MSRRKKLHRLAAALLLLALCVLPLSACGEADEAMGLYRCVAAEAEGFSVEPEELYPQGLSLELGSGGKGRLLLGEESAGLSWSRQGENLSLSLGGQRATGSLDGGVLRLRIGEDRLVLTLLRQDLDASLLVTPGPDPEALDYWLGDWFGRWSVSGSTGSLADTWYDCCASVRLTEDGGALLMLLWDEDGARDRPMGAVELRVTEDGRVALSDQGNFWLSRVGRDQWRIDLDESGFSDTMLIRGRHESDSERFDYEILLRPWGASWAELEEADESLLPYRYDWYLRELAAGSPMPDSLPPLS